LPQEFTATSLLRRLLLWLPSFTILDAIPLMGFTA
jgi:hypothetical protein